MKLSPIRSAVLTFAACAVLAALPAAAQPLTLPQVSPHAVVSQTVGLTDVTVDYHRPSVNGRTIWGGLVPYGAVWRAGANDNTTITFSQPVRVEGQELAAGTYGLHMIPGEGEWVIAFSDNSTSWGSFSYDEAEDALRVTVTPQSAPFEEQLRYEVSDVDRDSATVSLYWEKLRVPFRVETDTNAIALQTIRQELRHLAGFNWQGWAQAANYVLQNDLDADLGLEWAERSIGLQENIQNLSLKARLLDKAGRGDEAAETLARAEAQASSEAEVNQLGYVYLQSGDVDRAIAVFQRNVDDHPESWNVWDSLGEAWAAKGDDAKAVSFYDKALEMAPEGQKPRIEGVLNQLRADD
jgi:tetratricopeptide (TPR) repeat protein